MKTKNKKQTVASLRKEAVVIDKMLKQITEFLKITQNYSGEWKTMTENPNYSIFDDGNIWNHKRMIFMKRAKHVLGYQFAGRFVVDGKKRFMTVHQMVGRHFLSNPNNYTELHHIDNDKKNNHASNLEYVSRQENMIKAWDEGYMEKCRTNFKTQLGIEHPKSKLTEFQVKYVKSNPKMDIKTLSNYFNVSKSTISSIRSGRTWSHLSVD